MASFVSKVLGNLKPSHDDDSVDRMNYFFTALMFGFCAVTIASKQYVGQPIQCWIPAEFKSSWEKYVEDYCFVENTYFVNMKEKYPEKSKRADLEIGYYQWVPLILVVQMVACFLPKFLFTAFNISAGYSIEKMVDTVGLIKEDKKEKKFTFKEDQEKAAKTTTNYLSEIFHLRRAKIHQSPGNSFRPLKAAFYKSGNTKLYLIYKLLNLINTLGQIYLLNQYLWPEHDLWGYSFMQDLIHEKHWQESGKFPRVTFCDVDIREIGEEPVPYSIQCVLMINMFNEKVYIFIWFWLLILSALNAINLIYWLFNTHLHCNSMGFVRRNLSYHGAYPPDTEIAYFIDHYLFMDGITTLRLLESNCGELVTSDMVKNLWSDFDSKMNFPKQKKLLELKFSAEDEEPNMETSVYSITNQMTQSTYTTTTSANSDTPRNYSNNTTLRAAHQRVKNEDDEYVRQRNPGYYPISGV